MLPGFVHEAGLEVLVKEADAVAPQAHRSFNRTNAYFTKDDPSFGIGHPIRRFYDRSNAFVPADNFPRTGPLRRIYEFEGFMPFIRDGFERKPEDRFFRYDDPLADVIINVVEKRRQAFPWHFDTNNYTVTLAIQNGEDRRCTFEYVTQSADQPKTRISREVACDFGWQTGVAAYTSWNCNRATCRYSRGSYALAPGSAG